MFIIRSSIMSTSNFKITPFKKIIELTENNQNKKMEKVQFVIQTSKPFQYAITGEENLSKPVTFTETKTNVLDKTVDVKDGSLCLSL